MTGIAEVSGEWVKQYMKTHIFGKRVCKVSGWAKRSALDMLLSLLYSVFYVTK